MLTEATAELCISLLLASSRRLFEANKAAREGDWTTWEPYFMCGKEIRGSVVGIYGLGAVGKSVAEKISPFRPSSIIYNNRRERSDVNYKYVNFESLLSESDFLILTASSNAQNREIFNKKAFESMKKDCILINVGR